jgi:proline iminopeptidase
MIAGRAAAIDDARGAWPGSSGARAIGGNAMRDRLRLDEIELAYEAWGQGESLICLHGGMGVDSAYLRVPGIIGLAPARRVILFDQRGHGASGRSAPNDYTHIRWAQDLGDFAAAVAPGPFSLLGHSYGGFIALEFALRCRDRLKALILVGTSAGPVAASPPPIRDEAELRDFFGTRWPDFFPGPEKHWDIFDRLTFSRGPFEAAFRRELPRYDVRDRVASFSIPTLLVVGSEDHYRGDMEWLAGALPRARLVVVPHAGHLPFLDDPDGFRGEVDSFLRRCMA